MNAPTATEFAPRSPSAPLEMSPELSQKLEQRGHSLKSSSNTSDAKSLFATVVAVSSKLEEEDENTPKPRESTTASLLNAVMIAPVTNQVISAPTTMDLHLMNNQAKKNEPGIGDIKNLLGGLDISCSRASATAGGSGVGEAIPKPTSLARQVSAPSAPSSRLPVLAFAGATQSQDDAFLALFTKTNKVEKPGTKQKTSRTSSRGSNNTSPPKRQSKSTIRKSKSVGSSADSPPRARISTGSKEYSAALRKYKKHQDNQEEEEDQPKGRASTGGILRNHGDMMDDTSEDDDEEEASTSQSVGDTEESIVDKHEKQKAVIQSLRQTLSTGNYVVPSSTIKKPRMRKTKSLGDQQEPEQAPSHRKLSPKPRKSAREAGRPSSGRKGRKSATSPKRGSNKGGSPTKRESTDGSPKRASSDESPKKPERALDEAPKKRESAGARTSAAKREGRRMRRSESFTARTSSSATEQTKQRRRRAGSVEDRRRKGPDTLGISSSRNSSKVVHPPRLSRATSEPVTPLTDPRNPASIALDGSNGDDDEDDDDNHRTMDHSANTSITERRRRRKEKQNTKMDGSSRTHTRRTRGERSANNRSSGTSSPPTKARSPKRGPSNQASSVGKSPRNGSRKRDPHAVLQNQLQQAAHHMPALGPYANAADEIDEEELYEKPKEHKSETRRKSAHPKVQQPQPEEQKDGWTTYVFSTAMDTARATAAGLGDVATTTVNVAATATAELGEVAAETTGVFRTTSGTNLMGMLRGGGGEYDAQPDSPTKSRRRDRNKNAKVPRTRSGGNLMGLIRGGASGGEETSVSSSVKMDDDSRRRKFF
ncbi:expressed unknown protein [Seminavis robusta]|uniref:Uncharacterized protein n=1 Tax=Seminavis robusta TaxID=568900 RepID=A0A9N8DVK7_9STRA|nr:expressed unknown protein [Seminavis robusta]|eukprot:Sro278_g106500.1 n/a (822) ;mRNA; f:13382-15932